MGRKLELRHEICNHPIKLFLHKFNHLAGIEVIYMHGGCSRGVSRCAMSTSKLILNVHLSSTTVPCRMSTTEQTCASRFLTFISYNISFSRHPFPQIQGRDRGR